MIGRLLPAFALTAALLLPPAACAQDGADPIPRPSPDVLAGLWEEGRTFDAFLGSADARRETWNGNWETSEVPPELLARARSAVAAGSGVWRILAVAEDWCGDSVHTVPYLARLAADVDGLELRVVDSRLGRPIMESHRTPDRRAATPTVLLLGDGFQEEGCMVERPPELQEWFLAAEDSLPREELFREKYARYETDRGVMTVEEWVRVLEAAAAGGTRCVAETVGPG